MTALCSTAPISRYIQISVKVVRIMDKCKSHPYKVARTDGLTTKRCSISPPPFTYWYWVEQISFTQSFRLTALDPYGDQNSARDDDSRRQAISASTNLSHRPDPRALLLTSRFCIRDV